MTKSKKPAFMKDVTNLESGIFHDYFNKRKHNEIEKLKNEKFERPRTH